MRVHACFVGQLPFDATVTSISDFFEKAIGEPVEVRPLTNKKTGAFRGIAFVDLFSKAALPKALALNRELFEGRRLSVEQTVAGAGASVKRVEKLTALKTDRDVSAEKALEARIVEVCAMAKGGIKAEDFDKRAKEFLLMFPTELSCTALLELGRKDMGPVRNRAAYVMGVLKRIRQEECKH